MEEDKKIAEKPGSKIATLLRGTKKQRLLKRLKEIREEHATRFRKLPPEVGVRTSEWETIKEPKNSLYGIPRVVNDGGRTLIAYKIRTGWKYIFSPQDYNEKGKLKPMAQPLDKQPIVEEKIEEVR